MPVHDVLIIGAGLAGQRAALAAACVALGTGCPARPRAVVYDLADRLPGADRWSTRAVVLFGTPSAEPCLREGFYTEAGGAAADRFLWSKGEAELALGRHAAAGQAFASAHARAIEIASPYRHDAAAGLARVALAQGDSEAAGRFQRQS